MFIAHLPAGYILARHLLQKRHPVSATRRAILVAAMAGAIAPDLDMLYVYLVDHGQTHHHTYPSHWPMLWFGLLAMSLAAMRLVKGRSWPVLALIVSLGGILHLLLDSVVGDIWWLAPLLDRPYALFSVAARVQPWWLNFLLHWSFALELLIVAWAVKLRWQPTSHPRQTRPSEPAEPQG